MTADRTVDAEPDTPRDHIRPPSGRQLDFGIGDTPNHGKQVLPSQSDRQYK